MSALGCFWVQLLIRVTRFWDFATHEGNEVERFQLRYAPKIPSKYSNRAALTVSDTLLNAPVTVPP